METNIQRCLEVEYLLQPMMLSTFILQEMLSVPKANPTKHGLGLNSTKFINYFLSTHHVHLLATVPWRLHMMYP